MIQTETLRFRKGDWLAVAIVAVLAVALILCFLPEESTSANYAEIYLDGQLINTVPLAENATYTVEDEYCSEITVKDGSICFSAATCPGQDCVHSGSISSSGRSLVCLPNRVEIRIVSAQTDVDFVVG